MSLIRSVGQTYLFWFLFWISVSVYGTEYWLFSNTFFLAVFPPAGLYLIEEYWGFLGLPISMSIVVASAVTFFIYRGGAYHKYIGFIANSLFLLFFLVFSETYLSYSIDKEFEQKNVTCFERESFVKSLFEYSPSGQHTIYATDEAIYRWSFRFNRFYRSSTALWVLRCTPDHDEYWKNPKEYYRKRREAISSIET